MEKKYHTGKLYSRMRLWELPDQYVAEPIDGSSGSCLAVNRDGCMTLVGLFFQFGYNKIHNSCLHF